MKKLVLSSVAFLVLVAGPGMAADMTPVLGPPVLSPPVRAPVFSWTGLYIGGNVGGAWGQTAITDNVFGLDFSGGSTNVFIAGGQVGGNYQFGNNFVAGVDGEFDWAANNNNRGNVVVVPTVGDSIQAGSNNRWMSTLAARFGWAIERYWLFYAKGGVGFVANDNFTVTDLTTRTSFAGSNSTSIGWLVGAGAEWAFANNWTFKLEYDYLVLGSRTFTVPVGSASILAGDTFTTGKNGIGIVQAGVNFLFNGGSY